MEKPEQNNDLRKLLMAGVNSSPYYHHIGMRLVEVTDEGSVMELEVLPETKNLYDTMHGGAISGVVDSACGTAMIPVLNENESAVTLDLRVQFFAPIREGKLTARGRVVNRTRRYVVTEAEVFDQENNLVARGSTIHTLINKGMEESIRTNTD